MMINFAPMSSEAVWVNDFMWCSCCNQIERKLQRNTEKCEFSFETYMCILYNLYSKAYKNSKLDFRNYSLAWIFALWNDSDKGNCI